MTAGPTSDEHGASSDPVVPLLPVLPPAPTSMPMAAERWRDRVAERLDGPPVEEFGLPLRWTGLLRQMVQWALVGCFVASFAGVTVLLLVWQQARSAGLLSVQLERAREVFEIVSLAERSSALVALGFGAAWMAMATADVRRVTGVRRNPAVAAASLLVGVVGVRVIGDGVVDRSADASGRIAGFVLQVVFVVLPWLVLERVALVAYARRSALRLAVACAVGYLAVAEAGSVVSSVVFPSAPAAPGEAGAPWGSMAMWVTFGALFQLMGVLAVVEAATSIERGTQRRLAMRRSAVSAGGRG